MIMAGNPNWWSMHPPSSHQSYVLGSSSSSIPMNFFTDSQETPHSWSQMLFAGLPGEEERMVGSNNHFEESNKKMENNWEEQIILNNNNNNPSSSSSSSRLSLVDVIKQEGGGGNLYGGGHGGSDQEFSSSSGSAYWLNNNMTIMPPVTIPSNKSRPITTTSSSSNNNTYDILDFTHNNNNNNNNKHNKPLHNNNNPSSQSNKKARVQASPSQPPLKVRKEKLGDRITALHQLVSPFGKTDTASVLLEAIGYIRFLQGQIEALSSPYMSNASKNTRNQHSVHGERNSVFPEDPGQLLNDTGLKRKGASSNQEGIEEKGRDLRSRGLCLVPLSCTQHQFGNEHNNNGADYWAPAYATGF